MGRPKGTSNRQFSNEEKEKILLEHYNEHVSWNEIYRKYNLSSSLVYSWSVKYRENGVKGLDSNSGKHNNNYGGLYLPKNKIEELELELMKKDIEIARLKKGYMVKGVGAKKEFVTTLDKNIK